MSQVLFSAPHNFFITKLKKIKKKKFIFREIWNPNQLFKSKKIKIWIVNPGQKFVIDENILNYFPNLEILATPSTGKNHINLLECKKKKIRVLSLLNNRTRLKEIRASSEFTFLLILNSLRRLQDMNNEIMNGSWRDNEHKIRGYELFQKKIGIVGLGRIGGNIANWCHTFGSDVIYYDPFKNIKKYKKTSLQFIFKNCDIILISVSLTNKTYNLINRKLLSNLKYNSHLINTSRGEVINQNDLINYLSKSKKNVSFTSDVLSNEVKGKPLTPELINLYKSGKIFLTPHMAGATFESQFKAADIIIEEINKLYE